MNPLDEIKRLYFKTTRTTIEADIARAIELLRMMPEDDRDRAGVYMEGLVEMRGEWSQSRPRATGPPSRRKRND
ncbi:MAG: hypothetical protein ABI051_10180 [Vicinamibacterales bacterium]